MTQAIGTKKKVGGFQGRPRWAFCPVCQRERGFTQDGVMKSHRVWVAQGKYGTMVPCGGSGLRPRTLDITSH